MAGLLRNAVSNRRLRESGIFEVEPELKTYRIVEVSGNHYRLVDKSDSTKSVIVKVQK